MGKFERSKVIPGRDSDQEFLEITHKGRTKIQILDDKDEPQSKETDKTKLKKRKKKPFVDRKKIKEILREKRARLVVKNLPFKATEEKIREYFGQYGDISNVNILKKPDGKLIGCAFIQYTLVQFARKAQHYTNNEVFMGRTLKVDFAKAKDKYVKENRRATGKTETKNESLEDSETDDVVVIED